MSGKKQMSPRMERAIGGALAIVVGLVATFFFHVTGFVLATVLLVVDAESAGQSVAAVAHGFATFPGAPSECRTPGVPS